MLPIVISALVVFAAWRFWRYVRRSLRATPRRNEDFIFF